MGLWLRSEQISYISGDFRVIWSQLIFLVKNNRKSFNKFGLKIGRFQSEPISNPSIQIGSKSCQVIFGTILTKYLGQFFWVDLTSIFFHFWSGARFCHPRPIFRMATGGQKIIFHEIFFYHSKDHKKLCNRLRFQPNRFISVEVRAKLRKQWFLADFWKKYPTLVSTPVVDLPYVIFA